QLGRALAPLRDEGVLIVGSGSLTHDLSEFRAYRGAMDAPEPAWVTDFADWFAAAIAERRTSDLLAYRRLAPNAAKNHPTEEHLLPMYVASARAAMVRPSTCTPAPRMACCGWMCSHSIEGV